MPQPRFNSFNVTPPPRRVFDDIPILHKLADIYKTWHAGLPQLPRLSRYTLGQKIDALFCDILELILEAGYASRDGKQPIISRASVKLDALKFFLRLAWELKVIDTKKYTLLIEPLVEAGRMLGGWRKQLVNKTPPA
ncbi:MAG: four helix bundle protein [Patescibacteria group bacterium]